MYRGCSPHICKPFQSRSCGSRDCRSRVSINWNKATMVVASKFWSYGNSMGLLLIERKFRRDLELPSTNPPRSGLHDQVVHPIKSACHVVGAEGSEAGTPSGWATGLMQEVASKALIISGLILVFLLFLKLFLHCLSLLSKPLL